MPSSSDLDSEVRALLRLTLADGVGPVRLRQLMSRFQSARSVFRAGRKQLLAVDGVGREVVGAITDAQLSEKTEAEWRRIQDSGARLLSFRDDEYPPLLNEIHGGPLLLRIRGELRPLDKLAVAVVGSRKCSSYGRKTAERLARDLASLGVTIVSGLARGIDAVAHRAALNAGGRTVAVLASGLARIYPPEHDELAADVVENGALLSEAPMDGAPIGELFPQRNRIISGMSLGVIVVEAGLRSGTLSTARHALDQNREVFAVPGRIGDKTSEGTNLLIKQGACLVRGVDDVLEQLGPIELPIARRDESAQTSAESAPLPQGLDPVQLRIIEALDADDVELETLLEKTGLRASEANSALFMLEMKKIVRRKPGNRYERIR